MNRTFHAIAILAIAAVIGLSSCYKEETIRFSPAIAFLKDSGYVYQNISVTPGSTVWTGVIASRNDSADGLKEVNITKRIDNEPETIVLKRELAGMDTLYYKQDYLITTRQEPGTETYIYRVVNQDLEYETVELIVTVR